MTGDRDNKATDDERTAALSLVRDGMLDRSRESLGEDALATRATSGGDGA
jgi:hypothetical protein